jgi:hypothetical protein
VTRNAWQWIAVAMGPVAWFADLVVSYAVSPGPHRPRDASLLLAISGTAFALTGAAALIAWHQLRAPAVERASRPRFLAHAGLALAVLSLMLIAATAAPTLVLAPGAEP